MSSIIYKTKFLELKEAKSPQNHPWYYVRRTNDTNKHDSGVVLTTLVKINNEYNFLLLKTTRPPLYAENKANVCLESPAGLIGDIDKNETIDNCIKKELLEETGLIADSIYFELYNSSTSAGVSSETLTYTTIIVNNDKIVKEPVNDGGIILERFYIPVNDIHKYIEEVSASDISVAAPTICGIYYALMRLNKLNIK